MRSILLKFSTKLKARKKETILPKVDWATSLILAIENIEKCTCSKYKSKTQKWRCDFSSRFTKKKNVRKYFFKTTTKQHRDCRKACLDTSKNAKWKIFAVIKVYQGQYLLSDWHRKTVQVYGFEHMYLSLRSLFVVQMGSGEWFSCERKRKKKKHNKCDNLNRWLEKKPIIANKRFEFVPQGIY